MYQENGSITLYGWAAVVDRHPESWCCGRRVTERWNRRLTMLLGARRGGFCALAMALAYQAGALTIELIVPC